LRGTAAFAERLLNSGATPSAISQAVRTLEARVGAARFIRTTRSVGLTEAGERFISREARIRGARYRKRDRAWTWTAAGRAVAPLGAARGGADPAGAADRILRPSLPRGRSGDRRKRGAGRPRGRRRPLSHMPHLVWRSLVIATACPRQPMCWLKAGDPRIEARRLRGIVDVAGSRSRSVSSNLKGFAQLRARVFRYDLSPSLVRR
jgi:DNA-binding transcriptional LysR family regulator